MPFFEKSIARQSEFAILVHQGDACSTDFLHGHAPDLLTNAYDGTFSAELEDCDRIATGPPAPPVHPGGRSVSPDQNPRAGSHPA